MKNGQTTPVNPSPGPSTAVGDSIQLVSQAPGLLKQTVVKGFPGWQGDLYWCGAGVTPTVTRALWRIGRIALTKPASRPCRRAPF